MALQDRLVSEGGSLTPAERRTATVLLQDSKDVLFLAAAEVAARAGVHESTVIRLARKLGYDGYAALREEMREHAQHFNVSARAHYRDRKGHQLSQLVEDEAKAILGLADTIDQQRLDELARTLIDAGRIFVYGAPILVASVEKRLRRIGLDVVDLPNEGRDLPEKLLAIGRGDVFFAFVLREPYPALPKLMLHAQQRGADVVIVSDVPGVKLPVTPQHTIIALRGADTMFRTMTVPIVFGYALELAIHHIARDTCADAVDRLDFLGPVLGASKPRTDIKGASA